MAFLILLPQEKCGQGHKNLGSLSRSFFLPSFVSICSSLTCSLCHLRRYHYYGVQDPEATVRSMWPHTAWSLAS